MFQKILKYRGSIIVLGKYNIFRPVIGLFSWQSARMGRSPATARRLFARLLRLPTSNKNRICIHRAGTGAYNT